MAQQSDQLWQGQTTHQSATPSILSVEPWYLRNSLLLSTWPSGKAPEGDTPNSVPYSTLGCCVVIYRNIIRHLLTQQVFVETIDRIGRELDDPSEARLWEFILFSWQSEKQTFPRETTEAVLALRKILDAHPSPNFTAFEISEACRKIWGTAHLQSHALYTRGQSQQWERVRDSNDTGDTRRPSFKWDGQGASGTKLQQHVSPLPFGEGGQPMQLRWTMLLVFRISYQSETEMPGIFDRIRSLELYDPALPEEERSASTQYHYRLFGVVRTANVGDYPRHDLVRIYDLFADLSGQTVVPDIKMDSVFFPSEWTLSEPNRQFFLYYGQVKKHHLLPEFAPCEKAVDRLRWMRNPMFSDLWP